MEAVGERAVANRLGVVYGVDPGLLLQFAVVLQRSPVLVAEIHTQMPLADAGRAVAFGFEHAGDGGPLGIHERWIDAPEHTGFESGAPAVPTGQESVAGRGADGRRRVSVGEAYAFGGNTIHRGRWNPGVRVVGSNVAIAEIVCEYNHDIGWFCSLS